MHDTRRAVLEAIRNQCADQGQATVASLAEALGISAISVRHHLTSLQAAGMVRVELQRQAVGRPKHVYSLTEAAERQFAPPAPNTYHLLAERLLDELKATLSPEQVSIIIDRIAEGIVARYGAVRIAGSLEARVQQLINLLGDEGVRAAIRKVDEKTLLTEVNCPYVYVGQRHPEVCQIDGLLIRSVLGMDVQRTSCVLYGDRACTFSIENKT